MDPGGPVLLGRPGIIATYSLLTYLRTLFISTTGVGVITQGDTTMIANSGSSRFFSRIGLLVMAFLMALGLPGFSDVSLPACHGPRTPADLHTLANPAASVLPSVYVKTLGIRNKLISKLYWHFRERDLP